MICSAFFPDENIIPNKEKMALGQLRLVIECKNLPDHGWIFFENEKKDDIIIPDMYNFIKTYREEDITGKCIPHGLVTDLFYTSSYYETFLDSGTKSSSKSNSKESNLYEAILTSIKSTRHQIDKTEELRKSMFRYYNKLDKILFVTLYQPLIIFTGHMYGTKNDEDLQSIKYVQLKKSYESATYNEHLGSIHVVHYDTLDEYIDLIRNYYWSRSNYIVNHQSQLLHLVQDSLVRWEDFNPLNG